LTPFGAGGGGPFWVYRHVFQYWFVCSFGSGLMVGE
jgi:hypothetical protein